MPSATQTAAERLDKVRTRAVEIGIYLPLGAYARARDEIADFSRRDVEKLFDEFVDRGQDRLTTIESRLRRRAKTTRRDAEKSADRAKNTAGKATKKTAARAKAASRKGTAKTMPGVTAPTKASELPIVSYDSLTVDEIVTQLDGLTETSLAKIYKYEKANENRKTITDTIESRL